MVALRYRMILLTTVQCVAFGAWRNWHTLFTEQNMSGLVNNKYCKPPTKLLYKVISSRSRVSNFVLTWSILLRDKRFLIYFHWVNISPCLVYSTSIPRKNDRLSRSCTRKAFPRAWIKSYSWWMWSHDDNIISVD